MRRIIKVSDTDEGDGNFHSPISFSWKPIQTFIAISAVVIAIQMITKYCKKLKYQRKIVLVTNGRGELDADGITQITEKIKQDDIGLVVVYALLLNLIR